MWIFRKGCDRECTNASFKAFALDFCLWALQRYASRGWKLFCLDFSLKAEPDNEGGRWIIGALHGGGNGEFKQPGKLGNVSRWLNKHICPSPPPPQISLYPSQVLRSKYSMSRPKLPKSKWVEESDFLKTCSQLLIIRVLHSFSH